MSLVLNSFEDLVTSHEQTRAGFIDFALNKNKRANPIISDARSLKVLASRAKTASELLEIKGIENALLTSAGISDKALKYFNELDKTNAIQQLIKNFLEPAGADFVDELVYRFLLIRGDSLGGSMRNLVGVLAEKKLTSTILSNLSIQGTKAFYLSKKLKKWFPVELEKDFSEDIKGLAWKDRVLIYNLKIPLVDSNIDICLFGYSYENFSIKDSCLDNKNILMLGELKGGIDPAGADEHWKTANSALNRIRDSFNKSGLSVLTSFVGAAIEKKMAAEIFSQLQTQQLTYAANLTIDQQLVNYCDWVINL